MSQFELGQSKKKCMAEAGKVTGTSAVLGRERPEQVGKSASPLFNLSLELALGLRNALDDGGVGGAAALADGQKPVLALLPLQLVDQSGHQLHASGSKRVSQSHCATVDVELVQAAAEERLRHRQRHRREGLVHLDDGDVLRLEVGLLEDCCGSRDGTLQHDRGVTAHHSHRHELGLGLQTQLLEPCFVADEDGGSAVADLATGGGGEDSVGEHGFQGRNLLVCCCSDSLVRHVHLFRGVTLRQLHGDGEDLLLELAGLGGVGTPALAQHGELVQLLLAAIVFSGQKLGAAELAEVASVKPELLELFHAVPVVLHGLLP
mmetsp:Transcript_36099/g.54435  ORF Transcript_36099/g.54435 Transcript_36099/m.54435 type:complete len:319 (-) Transcript_36099:351-1307(-)